MSQEIKQGYWAARQLEAKPGRWQLTRIGSLFGEIIAWTQHVEISSAAAFHAVAAYEFRDLCRLVEKVHKVYKKGDAR